MRPFVGNGLALRSPSDLQRLVPAPGGVGEGTGSFGNAGLGGGRTDRSTSQAATRQRLPSGRPFWLIGMIAVWVLLSASHASRPLRYPPRCRHRHAADVHQRLNLSSHSRGAGADRMPPAIRFRNMSMVRAGLQSGENRCSSVFVNQTPEGPLFHRAL